MAGLMLVDFFNQLLFVYCLLICFHTIQSVLDEKDGWIWREMVLIHVIFMFV